MRGVLAVAVALVFAGCGVKGPPRPPEAPPVATATVAR